MHRGLAERYTAWLLDRKQDGLGRGDNAVVKWVKITKNQYFGLFALGFVFLLLQELPYIVMPWIPLASNPLMEMQDKSLVLNALEKLLGVSCIFGMLFLVRGDTKWLSLGTGGEKVFLCVAMLALAGYYVGWILYYNGVQTLLLILCLLVAPPPVYYAFIGLWRKNYVLAALGGAFLIAHILNVWNNLRT